MNPEVYKYISDGSKWIPNYCRKYFKSQEDADDLSQHVIERVLLNSSKWRGEGGESGFKSWVKTIIHNEFSTQYRRNQKKIKVPIEDAFFLSEDDFNNQIEKMDNNNLIQRCLEMIESEGKDNLVEVFKLKMEGYKYREISEKLSMPTGTIKILVFNARKKLSQKLGIALEVKEDKE